MEDAKLEDTKFGDTDDGNKKTDVSPAYLLDKVDSIISKLDSISNKITGISESMNKSLDKISNCILDLQHIQNYKPKCRHENVSAISNGNSVTCMCYDCRNVFKYSDQPEDT